MGCCIISSSHYLKQLEKLKRLRSEIPPAAAWNFDILQATLHVTHLLKLPDKMYDYEMDSIRTVGTTERTRDAGRTDGRTDGKS